MKKSLLIAAAALAMLSANAQTRAAQTGASKVNPEAATKVRGVMQNAIATPAQKAESGYVFKNVKKVGANQAKYYRPRGTFYVNWDPESSGYYMPYLQTRPFEELTFLNASTAPMAGSTWAYQYRDGQEYVDETFEGQDFTYAWGRYNYPETPALRIPGVDSAYVVTQGAGLNRTTKAIEHGPFYGNILSVVNSSTAFGDEVNRLANPHYYGSSNRAYDQAYGFTAYTGANAVDGATNGWWFGRNNSGFNGFATAVEQPNLPYVLNGVYGYINWIKATGEFDIKCRVYRLDYMPQLVDSMNRVDPAMFDDDHLVASGTATVNSEMLEDGYAILRFDLEAYDADLDMDIQVTPEIDFPIMIVMSGYDVPEVQEMSFLITTDQEAEGWGEMAYNLHCDENGVITACYGLNYFFQSGAMTPGTSIFLDVTLPFMIYNYTNETGEYTFPNEGGKYSLNGHEGISIYADKGAEEFYYSLEDDSDVPEWLTIEIADGTGDFEGTVDVKATAAALPEGVTYREAKVKFYYAGARLIYTFMQGEKGETPAKPGDVNNDGEVDVQDINILVNIMLGKDDAANYDGRANVDGEGDIDVADINAVINIMLDK